MNANAYWYAVCPSDVVRPDKPRKVVLWEKAIVLWRNESGELAAYDDRCPHLGASLSLGRVVEGRLECPFHGFRFDREGRCQEIPNRIAGQIPKNMCTRRWITREKCGWAFLWFADAGVEPTEEIPFFDEVDDSFHHVTSEYEWPVHWSRVVENQMDFLHVSTVHRTTIGRFTPKKFTIHAEVNDDVHLKARIAERGETSRQWVHFIYPNLWLNRFGKGMAVSIAFVPEAENRTRLYLRTYNGLKLWPGARQATTYALHAVNRVVFAQDKDPVVSQTPLNALESRGDIPLAEDMPIIEFRKLRGKLERRARNNSDVAPKLRILSNANE